MKENIVNLLPDGIITILKPHQIEGIAFMHRNVLQQNFTPRGHKQSSKKYSLLSYFLENFGNFLNLTKRFNKFVEFFNFI